MSRSSIKLSHNLTTVLNACLILVLVIRADSKLTDTFHGQPNSNLSTCFQLLQGGRLMYSSAGGFNGTNAVISLTFLSFHNEGVLLYIGGLHGDYLGLYLREGRINYFIFNPSRLHMSLSGIHFRGDSRIELNRNYSVEFSFNQPRRQSVLNKDLYTTALRLDEATVQLLDFYIPDLQFESPVYFGGGPGGLNLNVQDFEGRLTDIRINGKELAASIQTLSQVTRC